SCRSISLPLQCRLDQHGSDQPDRPEGVGRARQSDSHHPAPSAQRKAKEPETPSVGLLFESAVGFGVDLLESVVVKLFSGHATHRFLHQSFKASSISSTSVSTTSCSTTSKSTVRVRS